MKRREGNFREFEIIGEAVNRALKLDPSLAITHSRRIVDLRNYIIHSYEKVDDVVIWGIITKHLPLLVDEVRILLKNEI